MKIGFIGTGNMGYPLLQGAVQEFGKENVTFISKHIEHMEKITAETGVPHVDSVPELVTKSDIIVLAVKPQYAKEIYPGFFPAITEGAAAKEKIIVSVMAGVDITALRESTGIQKIARAMPNTPAMFGEGMTCLCFGDGISGEEKEAICKLFRAVGKVEEIPEKLMNAAICANGSSPAFAFIFMEALADAVVQYGMPRDTAYRLVGQAMLGSAKMLLASGKHPGELKDAVCSPGGTTIAGVAALEEYGLRNAVIKAADACYKRAEEL